jgi:hypothetical protein
MRSARQAPRLPAGGFLQAASRRGATLAIKNTSSSPLRTGAHSTSGSTSTANVTDRARELCQQIQEKADCRSQRLSELIALCKKVKTWVDWMELHLISQELGSSYVADALDTVLIRDLQQQIPDRPSDDELLALRRVCQRLPTGSTRDELVQQLAPAIEQQIDRLMIDCKAGGAPPQLVWATQDVLEGWQGLAPKDSPLQDTIAFALSQLLPPDPTPSIAQQIKRCVTQHGNNPTLLVDMLLNVTSAYKDEEYKGSTTFQDWLDLFHTWELLEDSLALKLRPVLNAVAAGFEDAEWTEVESFLRQIPGSAQNYALLKDALWDLLSQRPKRPSGFVQASPNLFSRLLDKTPGDIWAHVARQFLPSTLATYPTTPSLETLASGLPNVCAMSLTNRWFHRCMGPVLALWARHLLHHRPWFTAKTPGDNPVPRWAKLPLMNFVQWMKAGEEGKAVQNDEDHLKSLLSAILAATSEDDMAGALDRLWNLHGAHPEQLRAPYDQMPRLLAELALGLPAPSVRYFSAAKQSVVRWLKEHIKDGPLAEPVWLELGIGAHALQRDYDRLPDLAKVYFSGLSWKDFLPQDFTSKFAPWPGADNGMTGIVWVLMSTPAYESLNIPKATPQHITDALDFLWRFSEAHPLRGTPQTVMHVLQQWASTGQLTVPQRELLNRCLSNDVARRTPQVLALV